jgi:hypothetical protein
MSEPIPAGAAGPTHHEPSANDMDHWVVTNPWVFFGIGGAVVAYLLYMMVRRRKGERRGVANREPEL